jgi:small GTP-binding protein
MTISPRSSSSVPAAPASPSPTLPYRPANLPTCHPLPQCAVCSDHCISRSCLLHRFLKKEWRVLSSQTIGVEFASKIVKVGTGARRKRIKLQLWDTAGTERFRSVSRSYYRSAAGAILVYDVASSASFDALPTFLMDTRALASPNLTVLLAGNKQDLAVDAPVCANGHLLQDDVGWRPPETSSSVSSKQSSFPFDAAGGSVRSPSGFTIGSKQTATIAPDGREVSVETASRWASRSNIPVAVEVSALSGENVDELFSRLARMILTKIELGEINPDDPQSGIQYGDAGTSGGDMGSLKSVEDDAVRRKKARRRSGTNTWMGGVREWEDVFRISGASSRRRGGGCC